MHDQGDIQNTPNTARIPQLLFAAGVLLLLLQVWLPGYYLTGDGPCHIYNARILHDLFGGDASWSRFYDIRYQPDPNWFTTAILAMLLSVFGGVVAEKVFITMYIAAFLGGFWQLARQLTGRLSWWWLAIFALVLTHAFTKGFYNFSFSIAWMLWAVWAWIRWLGRNSRSNFVLFFLFLFLVFFTHLLAFVFTGITCAMLAVSHTFAGQAPRARLLLRRLGMLVLCALPFIILMCWFTGREGGMQFSLRPHPYRLVELAQAKHLVNFNHNELPWTIIIGCVLLLLCTIMLMQFKGLLRVRPHDGVLYALALAVLIYLVAPDDVLGRAMDMSTRNQLFVLLLAVLAIGCRAPRRFTDPAGAGVFFCFIILSALRMQTLLRAAAAEEDMLSVAVHISPRSVLLPLNFATGGKDGKRGEIADWNASFRHATQYLGADRHLVILDNYEANIGYFPLKWKEEVNPYMHLSIGQGIEGLPPAADIVAYEQKTGVRIDYILLYGFDPIFLSDWQFAALYRQVMARYAVVYTSPGGHAILMRHN